MMMTGPPLYKFTFRIAESEKSRVDEATMMVPWDPCSTVQMLAKSTW